MFRPALAFSMSSATPLADSHPFSLHSMCESKLDELARQKGPPRRKAGVMELERTNLPARGSLTRDAAHRLSLELLYGVLNKTIYVGDVSVISDHIEPVSFVVVD